MRSPIECVQQWNAALAANDMDAMNDLLHADYEVHEPAGLPYAGVYRGRDGWWALWERIGSTWTDFQITDGKLFAQVEGDDYAIMMRLRGRSIRTGKSFDTTLMEHWTFAEGKILSMRPHYYDTAYLAQVDSAVSD